jgi:hypothetical protein
MNPIQAEHSLSAIGTGIAAGFASSEPARVVTQRLIAKVQRVTERRRLRRLAGRPILIGYIAASFASLATVQAWDRVGVRGRFVVLGILLAAPAFAIVSSLMRSASNVRFRTRLTKQAEAEARVPVEVIRANLMTVEGGAEILPAIVALTGVATAAQVVLVPQGMYLFTMTVLLIAGPVWWVGSSRSLASVILPLAGSGAMATLANLALGWERALALLATSWLVPVLLRFAMRRVSEHEERDLEDVREALTAILAGDDLDAMVREDDVEAADPEEPPGTPGTVRHESPR